MAGSYYEKNARINLTTGEIIVEQTDLNLVREFIGGRGLGAKILYDEGVAAADPLSSENKLICVTGPLTGAIAPSSGRYTLATKSPVTGKIASSNSGGIWGAKLKYAGWDAVIIEGKAWEWTYLSIEDSSIRLYDARKYIGTMTTELNQMLKEKHGTDSSVLSIGPAGEKQILLSAVMNDTLRAAGRGGIGAVMGSKKLKAIVVKATRTHLDTIADPEALKASTMQALNIIRKSSTSEIGLRTLSRTALADIIESVGSMPVRSWHFSKSEQDKQLLAKPSGCYRCPIACSRAFQAERDDSNSNRTLFDQCSSLCNEYGLDTIGVQRTIAAAVELSRQGIITEQERAGIPLEWDALLEWTKRIGTPQTNFECLMSSGADSLSEYYGIPKNSRKKNPLSACKNHVVGQGNLLRQPGCLSKHEDAFKNFNAVIDSMGQCLVPSSMMGVQVYTDLLNAVTGSNWTAEQVLEIGDRIYHTECMFHQIASAIALI